MTNDPKVLSLLEADDANDPNAITFYTDVLIEEIVEIAELPVKNDGWQPARGEKWAVIDGCLIFRRGTQGKIRTTLTRDDVRQRMRDSLNGWITVPFTLREAHVQ